MSITIYGTIMSPFVRKARAFMAEKGIDYTLDQVNVFDPPEWFLDISPLKRIPVMRHTTAGGECILPDTSVICAYLERAFPKNNLYPSDIAEYGRALWFEEYGDTDLAAKIGFGILRSMMANPRDDAKIQDTLENKLPKNFDYLSNELGDREFMVGSDFSIADIAISTHFIAMRHAGVWFDQTRWPNLGAYLDRIHARSSFDACYQEERRLLNG
jgi:glutathione S-transferase